MFDIEAIANFFSLVYKQLEHQSQNIFNVKNEQLVILFGSFPVLQELAETKTQEVTQIREYVSAVISSSEPLSLGSILVHRESQIIKDCAKQLKRF